MMRLGQEYMASSVFVMEVWVICLSGVKYKEEKLTRALPPFLNVHTRRKISISFSARSFEIITIDRSEKAIRARV